MQITFLIIICHSAAVTHQCFCFYNIKIKKGKVHALICLLLVIILLMSTVQAGEAGGHLIHVQN